MATINVSLSDALMSWVEAQAKARDAGDYVRDLIRRDQERVGKVAELQHLIREGMESGIGTQSMDNLLRIARERVAGGVREGTV